MRRSTCYWWLINAWLVSSGVSGDSQGCAVGQAIDSTWEVTIGTLCGGNHTAIGTYVDAGFQNAFARVYVKYNSNWTPQKFLYLQVTTTTVVPAMTWYISSAPLAISTSVSGTYDVRFFISGTDRSVIAIQNSTVFEKCTAGAGIGIKPQNTTAITLLFVTDCKCDRNYELLSNGLCNKCESTRYKTTVANSSCLNCPWNKVFTDLDTCTCLPGSSGAMGETCIPCSAGSYNDRGGALSCSICGLHSTSPRNSTSIANCTCNHGYSSSDGGNCTMCVAGKYKNTQGNESCTDCPEAMFSSVTAATALSECRNCPKDSTAPAGSSNVSACACAVGYYTVNDTICSKCGVDTYSSSPGSSSCTQCPLEQSAPLGGTSIDACICMQGRDSQCECAAGSTHVYEFEYTVSAFNCNLAEAGNGVYVNTGLLHENSLVYYSTTPAPRFLYRRDAEWWISTKFNDLVYVLKFAACGLTPETVDELASRQWGCLDAKPCNGAIEWNRGGQTRVANVTRCVCNTNFVRSEYGVCTQCAPAFFKFVTATGFSDCRPCPANSSTLDPSKGINGCGCNVGFSGSNNGVCTRCAPGTHKFDIGPALCAKCPDLLHPLHNAFNASLRVPHCNTCQIGFVWNGGMQQCVQCAADEFNNRPGDSMCFQCVSTPEYFPLQQNLQMWLKFDAVPMRRLGLSSPESNTILIIDSSIYRRHGTYQWSADAAMQNDVYDLADFVEGNASFAIRGQDVFLNWIYLGGDFSFMVFFKYLPHANTSFLYLQERYRVDLTISRVGKQLHFVGSASNLSLYTSVPNGGLQPDRWYHFAWIVERSRRRWTIYFDGERTMVPSEFVPPFLATERHYQISGARHKMDDFRFYDRALSHHEVRAAYLQRDPNEICAFTNSSGATCPRLCRVDAGYQITESGANVQPCAINSYQNGFGLECQSCPLGSSTNTSGNTDLSACVCAMGYTREIPGIGSCKPCAVGTFKAVSGPSACTPCAEDQFSGEGAVICGCNVGFTGDVALQSCQACEVGKYKNTTGSAACYTCGPLRTSLLASREMSDCICNQGFVGLDAGPCESNATCSVNAHRIFGNSRMSCRCNAGHTGLDVWGPCESCAAGKYKEAFGSTACMWCPPNSDSAVGSSNQDDCLCNAGYSRDNHRLCTSCSAGTYKMLNGSHQCTMCPLNSISPTASRDIHDCICAKGSSGENGRNCTECAFGKFKDAVGSALCRDCEPNSVSLSNSKSENDCHCTSGYAHNPTADIPGTNSDLATLRTGATGWRLVRFLPPTSRKWYTINDHLRGLNETGIAYDYGKEWTIPFGDFDEFLIGTFGLDTWVYCSKSVATTPTYIAGGAATRINVFQTSATKQPHALAWYVAGSTSTELDGRPWISVYDRRTEVVYGSIHGRYIDLLKRNGGMAVWVRHSILTRCRRCEADTYSNTIGSRACTKCPDNSRAHPGSTHRIACVCIAGYTSVGNGPCLPCPINTYKSGNGSQSCLACPAHTTSGEESSMCQCMSGFTGPNDGPCTPCAAGTAKGVVGADACTPCPENTTSKSENSSHCVCLTGLHGRGLVWAHERGNPSTPPPLSNNTASPSGGNSYCGCVRGMHAPSLTSVHSNTVDCVQCPKGHIVSPTDGNCVSCGINTYNPTPLGIDCIACPNNTRSPSASVQRTDCKCRGAENGDAGFSGPDGGPCDTCPTDHYKGTVLRSGSCDKIVKSNSTITFPHAIDTPLRNILALSFRDKWALGDQIRVHRSDSRGVNDVVLTYAHSLIRGNYWMPLNVNPLLRTDDTYRFFVRRETLLQKNASESGMILRPV